MCRVFLKKRVKVIHGTDDYGNQVVDVPMLNPFALNILYEIVRRAKNKLPAANATDHLENYECTKTTFILVKSALRVGDKSTQAAAGFTFILQPTDDNAKKALKAALEELTREVSDDSKKYENANMNETLFHYKENEGNEIAVVCAMPYVNSETDNPADKDGDGKSDKTEAELMEEAQEKAQAEADYEPDDNSTDSSDTGNANSTSTDSGKQSDTKTTDNTGNTGEKDTDDKGKDSGDKQNSKDSKNDEKDEDNPDKMQKSRSECLSNLKKKYIEDATPLFKIMKLRFTGYGAQNTREQIAIIHYQKFYTQELKNFENGTYSDIEYALTSDEGRNILKNVGFTHRKELLNLYRTFRNEFDRIKNLPRTDFPNPDQEYDPEVLDEKGKPKTGAVAGLDVKTQQKAEAADNAYNTSKRNSGSTSSDSKETKKNSVKAMFESLG